jgi:uncharacterized repeat protein (TIGR01451 family)
MSSFKTRILAVTAGVLLAAVQAGATGTASGTPVNNQATVDYTVGTVNQPDVNSNTTTFVVDRRVLLTVAEVGGAYSDVAPGASAQVLTFTVTNNTNAVMDFRLAVTQDTTGTNEAFGGTDDFDATTPVAYLDVNDNGVYDGPDTATFLDEIPADETRRVFIVANIPLGQANGNTAGLTLTAIAADSGTGGTLGSDSTQTAGAEDPAVVDTVFGDVAGDTDGARDGRHSDDDAYRIQTATIAVTKTSTVISDPFNLTTNPKRIPGAVVEYCITVENTGSASATAVVVSDVLTGQPVTYQAGSLFTVNTGASCTGGDAEDDDNTGADESDPNGASQATGTVAATFATLPASAGKAVRFRVTID